MTNLAGSIARNELTIFAPTDMAFNKLFEDLGVSGLDPQFGSQRVADTAVRSVYSTRDYSPKYPRESRIPGKEEAIAILRLLTIACEYSRAKEPPEGIYGPAKIKQAQPVTEVIPVINILLVHVGLLPKEIQLNEWGKVNQQALITGYHWVIDEIGERRVIS